MINSNKISLGKLCILGLQHVLAMYAGAVIVPIILGNALSLNQEQITYLVSADLLTCGIATLLQAQGWKNFIGVKLPVIMGCTIIALAPMIAIGKAYGLVAIYGAIIVSGTLTFFLAPLVGKIMKLFPPVVIGSVITTIGLSLVPLGIKNIHEGATNCGLYNSTMLGLFVFCMVIMINKYSKNFIRSIAILLGIIVGTSLAYSLEMVNFLPIKQATWFRAIQPFHFGLPKFTLSGCIVMCLVTMITTIESIGIFAALGKICNQDITKKGIISGIRAEGLAQIIGAILNAPPHNTFAQNVGLVVLSKINTRLVAVSSGIILILLGLIPKFSALALIIPTPVLGAVMLIMFGMVAASGIKMLLDVDLENTNNLIVIACSIGIGVGISSVPTLFNGAPELIQIVFNNGIFVGALFAIILNVVLNLTGKQDSKI